MPVRMESERCYRTNTQTDRNASYIQYAFGTLNETQKKYTQIDKEAYAIIFGIKNFIIFCTVSVSHSLRIINSNL